MTTEALPDSVLGAHRAPTDTQRVTARSIIKEKQRNLFELDIQIARLNLKREAVSAGIQRYQEFLSPAQWLIQDLLAEIFIYCFPNANNPTSYLDFKNLPKVKHPNGYVDVPNTVAQVCRTWRQISHSTPRLWAGFSVIVDFEPCFALNGWLTRSKLYPLSFSLKMSVNDETKDSPAISALVKNGYRWKNVSICFPENSWAASKLTLATKFPLLESLSLYHVNFPSDTNIDAPKLMFLYLCNTRPTLSNESNLREIEINDYRGCMTAYDCLSMFRCCLALEKATIYMLYDSHRYRKCDPSMVTVTALRHLSIRSGFKNLQLFLDNMSAPALKRLDLLTEHNYGAVSLRDLLPFIKRSKCALVSLLLDGHYSGFDALLNCLERQPHLEQLSAVDHCLNGELMNHLVKPNSGHTSPFYICPKLTMLAFPPSHVQNPTQLKSLVQVISSRNQNTTGWWTSHDSSASNEHGEGAGHGEGTARDSGDGRIHEKGAKSRNQLAMRLIWK